MAKGRPPKYHDKVPEQALKLCRLGATDKFIAYFFDVDIATIAWWAWENREFFDAITPTDEQKRLWDEEKKNHREYINSRKRARMQRSKSARIRNAISARMWAALKGRSDGKLFSRLAYSEQDLVKHLESQFRDGMNWDNYGQWHVDHKKPCSLFNMEDRLQFDECWSLENLQPLWASDNIKKGAKYVSPER